MATPDISEWARLAIHIGGAEGFRVSLISNDPITIRVGRRESDLAAFLSDYPPLVRFVDLAELDGNLLITPQHPDELELPDSTLEAWTWEGVDITKESIWKDGTERRDSVQWRAAQEYMAAEFDVVFDDDAPGEAADLVCLKEDEDAIRLVLVHCKFAGDDTPGVRVGDIGEVASQAIRSAKWKWRFRDLCRHIVSREKRLTGNGRATRFLTGEAKTVNQLAKTSRFKEIRPEILIVQPGLSQANISKQQRVLLAAAHSYLKETIGVDLIAICSA